MQLSVSAPKRARNYSGNLFLVTMSTLFLFITELGFAGSSTLVLPTQLTKALPHFSDDMNWQNMDLAIERQIQNFDSSNDLSQRIQFGKDVYTKKDLRESLVRFRQVIQQNQQCQIKNSPATCELQMNQALSREFNIYVPVPATTDPGYNTAEPTKFTAYYSPDLEGSFTKTALYKNPVYALPAQDKFRTLSRDQIDFSQGLAGLGLELLWVKEDFFDLYLLQVQGGGRVRVKKGPQWESYYLSYAGGNGQAFRFISSYMVDRGWLTKDNRGVEAQRQVIEQNPTELRNIFSSNPNYIYFKFSATEPVGIEGIPLTEGRSAALDVRIYRSPGILNFVESYKPVKNSQGLPEPKAFSRFFIHQDTGGAIKGSARMDMYFGFGDAAAYVAYNTDYQGRQYFLVKKTIY